MNTKQKALRKMIGLFILFVLYTMSLKFIDIQKVGPQNAKVGWATINEYFLAKIGSNHLWCQVTEILGFFPLMIVGYFVVCGFWQLVLRKKISLVDKEIVFLGFLYAGSAAAYVFFERVIINYRPILVNGQLEPSYPSSHTFLAITVLLSAFYILYEQGKIKRIVSYLCLIGMIILVGGRALSGVHWITDIFGGILLSILFVSIYLSTLENSSDNNKKER